MAVVRIGAAEEETSMGMVPPIVTRNKRRRRFRRRLASGDGCGMGITGFAPVSDAKGSAPPIAGPVASLAERNPKAPAVKREAEEDWGR